MTTTDVEIAWAAGLFDGEGCVYFKNRNAHQPQLRIGGTCFDTINKFAEILEAAGVEFQWYDQDRASKSSLKFFYIVTVGRRFDVEKLCRLFLEHAVGKREELGLALMSCEMLAAGSSVQETNQKVGPLLPPPKYRKKEKVS